MSEIQLDITDGVAVVTLNAPQRRNALDVPMAEDFLAALTQVENTPEAAVCVIRGEGGHFCAGADRKVLADAGEDPADPDAYGGLGLVYRCFSAVDQLAVPTISAVRGWSVGAGVNLVLASDVRIMGKDACLRSGFFRIGIHPGGGHFSLISRLAGRETAAAMAVFGEDVTGEDAVRLGLAWQAVDDDEVDNRALEIAGRVSRDPELARLFATTLRQETGHAHLPISQASQLERATQMWTLRRKSLT